MTQLCTLPEKIFEPYNIENFVETGCWIGEGIKYASRLGIRNIFSCDIDEHAVLVSRQVVPDSHIYHADSKEFLRTVLPTLRGITMFWLDAHFPNEPWSQGFIDSAAQQLDLPEKKKIDIHEDYEFPLFDEIALIKELKYNYTQDIFFCDDVRVFYDEQNPMFQPETPREHRMYNRWKEFTNVLSKTHRLEVIMIGEGVAMWVPK